MESDAISDNALPIAGRDESPAAPDTRGASATKVRPGTPTGPARPGTPTGPARPGTPTGPARPGTPTGPARPGTPTGPARPGTPATPSTLASSLINSSVYSTPEEIGVATAVTITRIPPGTARIIDIPPRRTQATTVQNGSPVQRQLAVGSQSSPILRTGVGPTMRMSRDAHQVIMGEDRITSLPTTRASDTPPRVPEKDSVVSRLSRPTVASSARAASATTTASTSRATGITAVSAPRAATVASGASAVRATSATRVASDNTSARPLPQSTTMTSLRSAGQGFRTRLSAMLTTRPPMRTGGRRGAISAQGGQGPPRSLINRETEVESAMEVDSPVTVERPATVDRFVVTDNPVTGQASLAAEGDIVGPDMELFLSISRDQLDRLVEATRRIVDPERREQAILVVTAYGESIVAISAARKASLELNAAILTMSRHTTVLGNQALAVLRE